MKFPESPIAHYYLNGLKGIEIGGSAHNPFNIPGCLNVDCEPTNAHKEKEVELCGERLPIDVIAEADDLPFEDDAWDYVINSHVIEHLPNPIRALQEWMRVVKSGGYLLILVPTRDMNPDDRRYPYTTVEHLIDDYATGQTVATHPCLQGQGPRGHYHHFTPMRFAYFIGCAREFLTGRLEIVEAQEVDLKAHNGCEVLLRVVK